MKKILVMLLSLIMIFSIVGTVGAQEGEAEGFVPDPNNRFFGLQHAWMRVSHNIELWVTRSEERQAQLEENFARREQVLMERMLKSDNPERFEEILDKLRQRHQERLERMEKRIDRVREKREEAADRLKERLELLQERRQEIEERREERKRGRGK